MKPQTITKNILCGAFALACAGTASATLITNGSFESGTNPGAFTNLSAGSTAITGWTVGGQLDYIGSHWAASNGSRSVDLNGVAAGSLSQMISISGSGDITVNFDLAGNPDGGPATTIKHLRVSLSGFPDQNYTFDTTGRNRTNNMGWTSETAVFSGLSAGSYTLKFESLDSGFAGPALDNVSANFAASSVPDGGSTIAMLGLAMTAVAGARRKFGI